MYKKANFFSGNLNNFIQKLSKIPLLYQPGTKWNYIVSSDVLGYLVEVVSGKPFDQFLNERIFEPLKMVDTDFYVPKEKLGRFAALYSLDKEGKIIIADKPAISRFAKKQKLLSGGGGLVSTASDYMRFCQMFLNKGQLEGKRILGRKTVEFMTKNHLPFETGMPGMGFGLGFGVITDVAKTKTIGTEGEFFWMGIYNTFFWIDPKEEMITIIMTQFSPFRYYPIHNEFKVLTYQSIID